MHAHFRRFAAIVATTLILSACHRVEPVYEVENSPISISAEHKYTEEKVGSIITKAALSNGWLVDKVKPGELRITKNWGSFTAVSSIIYSKTEYSIELISSKNLDQEDGKIHHKYNDFVKILQNEINKKFDLDNQ